MKIKDIEKNLKKESDNVVVPDVYARVKKAPINRLLSDPVHAFQHKLAMRMLFIAVAILLVVAIALSAIWLTPKQGPAEEFGYVRVTINGDTVYGFAINNSEIVYASITEKESGVVKTVSNTACVNKNVADAINLLYTAQDGDEVNVSCHFDNYTTASTVVMRICNSIRWQGTSASVHSSANDSATRVSLTDYINLHWTSEVTVQNATVELVQLYIGIARSVS